MALFMETTEIAPDRTIAEISQALAQSGAQAILTEYKGGEIEAVSFRIEVAGQLVPFRLPCRWEAVYQLLQDCRRHARWRHEERDRAQAKRVAWRQILRWVQAQLALVQTSMVSVQEVFLPYVQLRGGQTLFERVAGQQFLQLENHAEGKR